MSQVTHRSPPLSPYARTARRPLPASGAWLFGGAVAACLGLGLIAVVVLLLWITSPYPDSGPGGALHVAADLWLLAHGARLVRAETLSGQPAPMALTPMLLAVPPAWLLYRTTLLALLEGEERGDGRGARSVVGWVAGGYLLVAGAAVCYTASGPLRVDVLSAVLRLPLFVVGVTAVAGWLGAGRPALELPAWLNWLNGVLARPLRRTLTRRRVLTAVRGAGAVAAVLGGGGALLAGGVTVWHAGAAQRAFPQLTDSWSGYIAVLLAAVALVPNAAVWGAAYALGPGFTLGAGSLVDPLGGAVGYPQLPHFPLLAALPGEGAGGPLTWGVGVLPFVAGVAGGWYVGRDVAPKAGRGGRARRADAEGAGGTLLVTVLMACCCGALMALLAGFAGGALGTGALAHFGPSWWLTGGAALCWAAVLGVPTALTVRGWRLRAGRGRRRVEKGRAEQSRPGREGRRKRPGDEWHTTASRHTRWAALKEASGGLMNDFDPRH